MPLSDLAQELAQLAKGLQEVSQTESETLVADRSHVVSGDVPAHLVVV